MTFVRPWLLLFALAPVVWAMWDWRNSTRRLALALKAASLVAILLALAEPTIQVVESKVAVAFLADTSASLTPADLRTESVLADMLERARGRHWMRVIPFARGTRVEMELDEEQFTGVGAYTFSAVMDVFLGLYTSMNSFSQLVVRTRQRKRILKQWPPRAGQKILM